MRLSIVLFALFISSVATANKPIIVGSKKFTEGVILGEIVSRKLVTSGISAQVQKELGGTRIIWNALLSGNIDVYVEYTGTIFSELVREANAGDLLDLKRKLAKKGIGISKPLGFNNTYGFGMARKKAAALGITKISDLANFPDLKLGVSAEFMNRTDGWPGVKKRYNLPQTAARGMEHEISYRALESGDIDLVDVYTTDGEIRTFDIFVLDDDRGFFPRYDAVIVYRKEILESNPEAAEVFASLEGSINQSAMTLMNAAVTVGRKRESQVASDFLNKTFNVDSHVKNVSRFDRIVLLTKEHLSLVSISLVLAILLGIPLGVVSAKFHRVGLITLQVVGIFQTIPALALLVILIRPLNAVGLHGIGETPAIIALFLYSLLPIVRNTHTGFTQFPHDLKESMHSLAMTSMQRIRHIEFPLAIPVILTGIKTAAVINVGFATLGALVGAGGYGQPILTGIRLDDYTLILEGAIPSAVLAVLVERFFTFCERFFIAKPLRI